MFHKATYVVYILTLFLVLVHCGNAKNEATGQTQSNTQHEVEEPLAATPSGIFRGSLMTSRRGRTINSFRGIRYALSPTAKLRFEPPRLIEQYAAEVDARSEGPGCPQPTEKPELVSEDCLRLNVYTTSLKGKKNPPGLVPVMVYFHAGGFYAVSGQSFYEGPAYLLDHDIVMVTVNYRLGSLGFISTGDKYAPGNLGFKDQVAALRWVQRNIAGFGGNPNSVTIFGYSAGSISVGLHLLSPMTKGLFHRAISMSGASTAQWTVPPHQRDLAEKQARILNCPTASSELIISCLKEKSEKELGDSLLQFYEFFYDPVLIWRPVVEGDYGQERFLTDDPETLIKAGKIHDVPLIIGMTELEFANQAFNLLRNSTLSEEMDTNWNKIAPISFVFERNSPQTPAIAQELRKYYLGDRRLLTSDDKTYNDTAYALGRLYGDALISFGVHRYTKLILEKLKCPVYYYKFNYTGSISHFYYPGTDKPLGAVHHDDLIYLFNAYGVAEPISLDSPHSHMVDKMTTMWTNFATNANPNPISDKQTVLSGLAWPVMTSSERKYLQINTDFAVDSNMFEDRFALWERLFPPRA